MNDLAFTVPEPYFAIVMHALATSRDIPMADGLPVMDLLAQQRRAQLETPHADDPAA